MLTEHGVCALCGAPYTHYGNNPEPLGDHDARVCDQCNESFVIPARTGLFSPRAIRVLRERLVDAER